MPPRADVVILGAGPAGAGLALGLARRGVRHIALLDKPGKRPFAVGESATPDVEKSLKNLGFHGKLSEFGHRPYHGGLSLWADGPVAHQDFLFKGQGHGWHLDRHNFDQSLQNQAQEAGVVLHPSSRPEAIQLVPEGWQIRFSHGKTLQARLLVDASGRAAVAAQSLGFKRQRLDRLVALACKARAAEALRGRILVEAVSNGWWYAADLPTGESVVMFMSDADLVKAQQLARPEVFEALWQSTKLLQKLVPVPASSASTIGHSPHIFPATSGYSTQAIAPGFIVIGDALLSFDPLTSSGIAAALSDAEAALEPILLWLDGRQPQVYRQAANDFGERAATSLQEYLSQRRQRYAEVKRFAAEEFWQRRLIRLKANPQMAAV